MTTGAALSSLRFRGRWGRRERPPDRVQKCLRRQPACASRIELMDPGGGRSRPALSCFYSGALSGPRRCRALQPGWSIFRPRLSRPRSGTPPVRVFKVDPQPRSDCHREIDLTRGRPQRIAIAADIVIHSPELLQVSRSLLRIRSARSPAQCAVVKGSAARANPVEAIKNPSRRGLEGCGCRSAT